MKKTLKLVVVALVAIGVVGCKTLPQKLGLPNTKGKETKTMTGGLMWLLLLLAMLASGCGTPLWDHQGQTITSGPGGYTITQTGRWYGGPKTTIKQKVVYGGEYVVDGPAYTEYVLDDDNGEVTYTTTTTRYVVEDAYPVVGYVPAEVSYYPGWTGTRWFGGGGGSYGYSSNYRQPRYWSNSRWNQNCLPQSGGHGGSGHGQSYGGNHHGNSSSGHNYSGSGRGGGRGNPGPSRGGGSPGRGHR